MFPPGETMNKASNNAEVPGALRVWFVIHFAVDLVFALPLMVAPELLLRGLGWQSIDPFAARLVAAALFGIGIESLLARNSRPEVFKGMLNLKIIWSLSAVVGIAVSMVSAGAERPLFTWLLLGTFVAFNFIWLYWRRRIGRILFRNR